MNAFKQVIYSLVITILPCSFHSYALQSEVKEKGNITYTHGNELKRLLDSKVLRVAMYKGNTRPFYFQETTDGIIGELQGIDVEIIKGFAKKLDLSVKFIRSDTLDGAVDMVVARKADLAICKLSITFSRANKVLFTKPYIKLRKGLLVNRIELKALQEDLGNITREEAIQQLAGKLGVIEDSSYVTFANQRFKQKSLEKMALASWDEIVQKVLDGKYIAAFRDEAEIKKVISDNERHAIHLLTVDLVGDYDPKGIALPLNANHLKALLDLHIDSLGLELTASSLLFDYDSVINKLNRYNNNE
ncbi:MAG: transporter substrate-binding domain-containing protein [Colwellia sp.]